MACLKATLLTATAGLAVAFAAPAFAQDTSADDGASDNANAIVVTGIRESLKNSIEVKKNANAVVDVITAEGVGKFPDRNIAESLSHIPGVSVDHQFGIGEKVSIQGTDPALNRIFVDGHAIASADWGGSPGDVTGRSFNYSLLAPEIVSRIEVFKSPEPRLDEGSLGGTVIVHTRMPLDLDPNTITGSIGYSYNDRSDKGNPRGSLLYSWHNADDTFGILVAGTYDNETLTRAGIEYFGYSSGSDFLTTDSSGNTVLKNSSATITGGTLSDLAAARYPYGINYDYFKQKRERIGGQFAVQYKPADNLLLTLTGLHIQGIYNNYSEAEFIVPGWATGQLESATISNGLVTNASFGSTTLPSTSAELDMNYRKTKVTNDSYNLAAEWNVGKLTLTANAGWTKATGGTNPEYLFNVQSNMPYSYSFDGTNTTVNYSTAPTDPTAFFRSDVGTVTLDDGTTFQGYQAGGIARSKQTDAEGYGQIDAKFDIDDSIFKDVRFGVKYSNHINRLDVFGSAVYFTDPISLADYNYTITPSGLFSGLNASGNATQYATLNAQEVIDALKSGIYVDQGRSYGSSFRVNEQVADAYVQLDFEHGPWRGNVGYRMAYTNDTSDFWTVSSYTDPDGNTIVTNTPTRVVNKDLKFLPSINVAYEVSPQLLIRGSIAEVMARPRYNQLAGAFSLNDTQLTGGTGNPNLKPYQSRNYELSAEWYFRPGSLLSVEYFRREISSYVVTKNEPMTLTNFTFGGTKEYNVSVPINASDATVNGVSVGFQTPIWGGFGIQTNYTFADAKAGVDPQGDVLNLPYLSKHTVNVIPYYENGPFQARVSFSYRTHYFTSVGRLNSDDSTAGYKQLDASIAYKINDHFTIHADAQNLLDSTYYSYSGTKAAPTAYYKNGRVFSGTIQFSF